MTHDEIINTPIERIYMILEKIQEQKIIELDLFKMTLLSSVQSVFDGKSKSLYDLFIKPNKEKTEDEKKADEEFRNYMVKRGHWSEEEAKNKEI
jgi:hypothetical protein